MFERFSLEARRAVFFARLEASRTRQESITPLCVARGVRDVQQGVDVRELDLRPDTSREMPLSDGATRVLFECSDISHAEGSSEVELSHLITALLRLEEPEIEEVLAPRNSPLPASRTRVRTVPVALLGLGGVGLALIRQILEHGSQHEKRYGLAFRFRVLADSKRALLISGEEDAVREVLDKKAAGRSLQAGHRERELVEALSQLSDHPGLVVDCSAAETSPELALARQAGWGLVLANKKPLTGPFGEFEVLVGSIPGVAAARWEATVGAGLPLIASLMRLRAGGDAVRSISGSVSSTLGFLMSGLDGGEPFSGLVREARRLGYAEPDPREDLSGRDVARKALILARTLGWPLEMSGVRVQGLLPQSFEELSAEEVWARLPELDASWTRAVEEAHSKGETLRYGFRLEPERAVVSTLSVSRESALGRLQGTNQLVEVYSRWYAENPLVIQGRGAGVEATAAGVLSDMVELAQLRRPGRG